MTTRATGSIVYGKFYVGSTGLVIGNFSYGFELNGASEAITITLTEDALGWYEYQFTTTTAGNLNFKITYSDFAFEDSWVIAASASSEYQTGSNIYSRFYIGTTGLVQGNFTYLLEKNNAATGQSLTISEDSGGYYDAYFNPDSFGDWIARIDYGDYHILFSAFVNQAGSGTTINLNATSVNSVSATSSSVGVSVSNSNISVSRASA